MKEMHININSMVKVKLSDEALRKYKEKLENDETYKRLGIKPKIKIDENGYYKTQLWCFMRDFGYMMYCGGEVIEKCDMILDYRDIKIEEVNGISPHDKVKLNIVENELLSYFKCSKFKIIYEDETIKIFYDNKFLQTSDEFTDKVLDICSKYLSEDALFKIAVLYDYLGVIKY